MENRVPPKAKIPKVVTWKQVSKSCCLGKVNLAVIRKMLFRNAKLFTIERSSVFLESTLLFNRSSLA